MLNDFQIDVYVVLRTKLAHVLVFKLVFHFLFFRISSTNFDEVYFHPHYMTHLSFVYTWYAMVEGICSWF